MASGSSTGCWRWCAALGWSSTRCSTRRELPAGGSAFYGGATLPRIESDRPKPAFAAGCGPTWPVWTSCATLVGRIAGSRVVATGEKEAEARAASSRRPTSAPRSPISAAASPAAAPQPAAALAHARLVFAFPPRVPASEVRFPQRAPDLRRHPAPRGPAALVARIGLGARLWRIARGAPSASRPGHPPDLRFLRRRRAPGREDISRHYLSPAGIIAGTPPERPPRSSTHG